MNVCIVCADKRFARMLELEARDIYNNVKVVTDKLSPPALKIAVSNCGLLIYDWQYYSGDTSFIKDIKVKSVILSKQRVKDIPENVKTVLIRPFSVEDFVNSITETPVFSNNMISENAIRSVGVIELDYYSKRAVICGNEFRFSPKEFSLLSLLYKNRGKVVSRQTVLESVWGKDSEYSKNVDNVYINYLRKKIDDTLGIKLICTVRGKGYMMK